MSDHLPKDGMLTKLQQRCTGMRRPEEFMRDPGVFVLSEENRGTRSLSFPVNEEYELTLTIGCRFFANRAQYEDSRRNAETIIARILYEDVLRDLSAIRHAVLDGDKGATLSRIDSLEARILK